MQQHLMEAAAAAAGAPYGTPVPFPVSFHPAYYATHASMATVNAAGPPPSIVSFLVCTSLFPCRFYRASAAVGM
jgi:plant G-box-binding factor